MHETTAAAPRIRGDAYRIYGPYRISPRRVAPPDVAVLVSTYQKPSHLRRVLVSLALQERVAGAMEVVVTDDGSQDETRKLVEQFAREAPFPLRFTTHAHDGFQLARCRNEGVAASTAPYLLFLDGDCVVPRDHVRQHLDHRADGWVMGGYCCRLDQATSTRITEEAIRQDVYRPWIPHRDMRRLSTRDLKARFYMLLRHPRKPRLAGGNIGIARRDYQRVNGYDENFIGWGAEDDDLRRRLTATGIRVGSILRWTWSYHLWHAPTPTAVRHFREGANSRYLLRPGRLNRCRNGLQKRPLADLKVSVPGAAELPGSQRQWLDRYLPHAARAIETSASTGEPKPEVELLFLPSSGRFSGMADCNVLIDLDGLLSSPPRSYRPALKRADLLLSPHPHPAFKSGWTHYHPHQTDELLAAIC